LILLALEQRSEAVRDWLECWVDSVEASKTLAFADKWERLRRLGVEVTVAKHGSELPRCVIELSLPLESESGLVRDGNKEFSPWRNDDEREYQRTLERDTRTSPDEGPRGQTAPCGTVSTGRQTVTAASQERGDLPGALCAWRVAGGGDAHQYPATARLVHHRL